VAISSASNLPAEFDLSGHTAIVASAGGDETPHIAAALAEAGAAVFAVARHAGSTDAIRAAVTAVTGADTQGYTGRWDTPNGAAAVLAAFDAVHPRADILVNDTRSFFAKPAVDIDLSEWDELHARNVRATFMLSQAVGQRMLGQRYGRIVNVISNLAERGIINCSAFSATQAAVLSLTRSLAVEWGRSEIRVNAVGSGWSTAEDIPLETQREELLVRYTPMRRKGHPRDLAAMLVYLCSPHCDYPSGQPVYIDGGLNAHP
jgi:NAD(P)-dependent dehydrogenase (short-subunit alcohol dehydrogenase family)